MSFESVPKKKRILGKEDRQFLKDHWFIFIASIFLISDFQEKVYV